MDSFLATEGAVYTVFFFFELFQIFKFFLFDYFYYNISLFFKYFNLMHFSFCFIDVGQFKKTLPKLKKNEELVIFLSCNIINVLTFIMKSH